MSRMVGKPEVIWLRLDQPLSCSARNTGLYGQVKKIASAKPTSHY